MDFNRYDFRGDPNTGMFAATNSELMLSPQGFEPDLGLETVDCRIAGTGFVGMFAASGPDGFLLPDVVRERELESLRDTGAEFSVMKSRDTALGNLVLSNSSGAYASPALSDKQQQIEEALGVPVEFGTVGGVPSPGACGVANGRGAVLHREASESEAEKVKEALGLEQVDIGTINTGSPFVGGGAVVQGEEVVTGENTSGPEIGRLDRTLG